MLKHGFEVADTIDNEYELLALSFDGTKPRFAQAAKKAGYFVKKLTIYYAMQCPYISNCIEQIKNYCANENIDLDFIEVNSLEKAKQMPCVFNNWAVFYQGSLRRCICSMKAI